MAKAIRILVCVVVAGGVAAPLMAAGPVSLQKRAQAKAMALRAARVDAMRKLGERIMGLSITAETKVQDFVAESDEIRTAMDAFLLGMREPEGYKPAFSEDGAATVKLEVTLNEVIEALRRIRSKYYKDGKKFKEEEFVKMTTTNKIKIITVIGQGAPKELPEHEDAEIVPSVDGVAAFGDFSKEVKGFWRAYCTARGRLMAERAARVDSLRRLAERTKGVQIVSGTTVQDMVAQNDGTVVTMKARIVGAKEIGVRYHSDELICEVELQIKLKQVYMNLYSWAKVHYQGDKMMLEKLRQKTLTTEIKVLKETGMGVPPEKYLKKVSEEIKTTVVLASKTPVWATRTVSAVGKGAINEDDTNKARARLMAERAALTDARRNLIEQIYGLAITSNTKVKDFVAEKDEIRASMMAFLAGSYLVEGSTKVDEGIVSVTVEIELKPLWNSVLFYKKKLSLPLD